jgi:HEPN domain-containing protein
VNRKELQSLAEARLADAKVLLKNRRYDGAYYLAGYAIECGLKACIAGRTKRHDFPDLELARKVWMHDLTQLREHAKLSDAMKEAFKIDRLLADNWITVSNWSEKSRYEKQSMENARKMVAAVGDEMGVLAWLRSYW